MKTDSVTAPWEIDSPLDMHLHLRQGEMLKQITPASAELFSGAVIMPNLVPPVTSQEMVRRYKTEIMAAAAPAYFEPYMTLFFREYTQRQLEEVQEDIIGIKLYPDGVTTNSASGINDILAYDQVFKSMAEIGIPLLIHGESHGFVMDREKEFLKTYSILADKYPSLMIVMEHITTSDAVTLLDQHENLYATVTLHHLLLTLDDMAGGLLNPHLFCKPIIKRPEDRSALQAAVLSGHKKLMFGSDSAPHPVSKKECCGCAAGVFSAPVALSMLAQFFDENNARDKYQGFVSNIAKQCYGISAPQKTIRLVQENWRVPNRIGDVVPFMAGSSMMWKALKK